jgi:hypothetical protein
MVTIEGLGIGGADSSNYSLSQPTTTAAITPWSAAGFHQPVGSINTYSGAPALSSNLHWNAVKGGQTVPLKFNLYATAGGTELTNVLDVQGFALVSLNCTPGPEVTVVEDTFATPGSTSLRYDGNQFHQNWQTPKAAGKCYRITMTGRDGSQLSAFFKSK